ELRRFLDSGEESFKPWATAAAATLFLEIHYDNRKIRLLNAIDLYVQSLAGATLTGKNATLRVPLMIEQSSQLHLQQISHGWVVVFFDLPVGTKEQRKVANNFRHDLIGDGYFMVQFSVYARPCGSADRVETHVRRLKICPTS